jgi:hypothetical protein
LLDAGEEAGGPAERGAKVPSTPLMRVTRYRTAPWCSFIPLLRVTQVLREVCFLLTLFYETNLALNARKQ